MGHRRLAVFATDAVTRYNTQFCIDGLYNAMLSRWQLGIPSTMSHDALRPIGWAWPFAIHVQPGLARLLGVVEIVGDGPERQRLLAAHAAYLDKKDEEDTREHIPRLKELLAPHLDGTEVPTFTTIASLLGPNLARRAFPDVFKDEDKAGLVPLSSLSPLAPGVYRCGELALVAHAYFRRSCTHRNNLNQELLSALEEASGTPDARVRIRLDSDIVGLAASYKMPIEHQYWYGPKFSSDLAKIPAGVTRHEANDEQRLFHSISRTEFWWQSRDGDHILEAEEIRDTTLESGSTYGCRYVHSMVNEASGTIHHLDGAIREYTEEQMLTRLGQDIAVAGRRSIYTKLWRVDGKISLATMKSLVHHHFRDNPLVAEYLEGKDGNDGDVVGALPAGSSATHSHARPSQIPYSISRGDGLQLMLAYHPRNREAELRDERTIEAFIHLDSNGKHHACLPAQAVELQKVLRRQGEMLTFPADVRVISYKDLYFDFPLIRHSSRQALEGTLAAFRQLVTGWKRRGHDSCFAINLSIDCDDRETAVSVAGHLDDVDAWLNGPAPMPPEEIELHAQWLEVKAQSLCSARRGEHQAMVLGETGIFVFERERVLRADLEILDGGRLKLAVDKNDTELIDAALSGALHIRPAYLIETSTCTKCDSEYRSCPCSKLLDAGVSQRIKAFKIAFFFWTDLPADNGPAAVVTTSCTD